MQRSRRRALVASSAGAATGAALLAACGGSAGPLTKSAPPAPSPTARPATALRPPLTYVAIGASDTAGVGVDDPEHEAWANVLAASLPQPVEVVNLGISGVSTQEAVEQELPEAVRVLNGKPGLVTVWLVVNDLLYGVPLDVYRASLGRLLGDLQQKTVAKVAVGNVPDPPSAFEYLRVPGMPPGRRRDVAQSWNAAIAEEVTRAGATLVDVFGRWPVGQHPEFIGPDGFHPSAAGYRSLAGVFRQTLAEQRII